MKRPPMMILHLPPKKPLPKPHYSPLTVVKFDDKYNFICKCGNAPGNRAMKLCVCCGINESHRKCYGINKHNYNGSNHARDHANHARVYTMQTSNTQDIP